MKTVAVPGAKESKQLFDVPPALEGIQPVWLKIQNNEEIWPAIIRDE